MKSKILMVGAMAAAMMAVAASARDASVSFDELATALRPKRNGRPSRVPGHRHRLTGMYVPRLPQSESDHAHVARAEAKRARKAEQLRGLVVAGGIAAV